MVDVKKEVKNFHFFVLSIEIQVAKKKKNCVYLLTIQTYMQNEKKKWFSAMAHKKHKHKVKRNNIYKKNTQEWERIVIKVVSNFLENEESVWTQLKFIWNVICIFNSRRKGKERENNILWNVEWEIRLFFLRFLVESLCVCEGGRWWIID